MSRVIPIISVLCTGLALGMLSVTILWLGRAEQRVVDEMPQFDPISATPDIADLRESRGSVLAGTSLGQSGDPTEFSTALANITGAEPPAIAARESLVTQLRRTAREYEEHAQRYELQERYDEADELRSLSEESRRIARHLAKDEPAQARLTFGSDRR